MNYPFKLGLLLCLALLPFVTIAQTKAQKVYLNPSTIEGQLVKITEPLRDFVEPPFDNIRVRTEKLGYHPKTDWVLNDSINPYAQPNGADPAWQLKYSKPLLNRSINQSFEGMGNSGVNPPDPCMDVGPNHVIQMINGSGGAYFEIFDRTGNQLQAQTYFDSFTSIGGLGDPIVLYDQAADRWMMSEFSATGNLMVVAVSQTSDPMGSWYIYSYQANNFPDYPKFGIWPNAYIVTTNENSPNVYALDRTAMLSGNAGTAQDFSVSSYGTISFQALTPVDWDGSTAPPSNEPAMVMRMADDAWANNLNQDQLELFEVDIDFNNAANSSLTLVQSIATDPFDTHLCGYTAFACIPQQGSSTTLDPLREVIMNRIQYRKFSNHETMVLCHVTDVTGNDRAGIRWYELRRTTGDWSIYQQGTYSPDDESRWMASIAINADGSIGLAYSTSSSNSYPSLKYTGRKECDPLGIMTEPETVIVAGGAANGSNRYGDYASMSVDPVDNEFWFTGQYVPATGGWSTRLAKFDIESCTPSVSFATSTISISEQDATIDNACLDYSEVEVVIELNQAASADPTVTLSLGGSATAGLDYEAPANLTSTLTATNLSASFIFKIFDDNYVETLETIDLTYTLNANGGNASSGNINQALSIEIISEDVLPITSSSATTVILDEDFESNTLGVFTTNNPSGDTPFQVATVTGASSNAYTVPTAPTGTYVAYVNDDDCNCNQNEVNLESPVLDLSAAISASLTFDYYYEDQVYQNNPEEAEVLISVDGGVTYVLLEELAGPDVWVVGYAIDLTNYVGQSNVKILFRYSDGTGWLYGLAVDNIKVETTASTAVQVAVNSTNPTEAYLAPMTTVYFYDEMTGDIMLSLNNTSTHDYGCTTVEVDRAGTNPSALQFSTANTDEYVASKTFKISPSNPSATGSYTIDLYYEEAEIAAWETATGNNRSILEIVKVAGDNKISDVTPANVSNYTISYNPATLGSFNSDVIVSSTISSGFSGFGIGKPASTTSSSSCLSFPTNTWIGGATGNWNDSVSDWSLGELPDYCHHVVIPAGKNVTVLNTEIAKGYTLTVDQSGTLTSEVGAIVDIIAPNTP